MVVKSLVIDLASRFGLDLVRYSSVWHPVGRRLRLMRSLNIDLVLDVGANAGQFGRQIRRHGYRGRIVSFEPLRDPFAALTREAAGDPKWEVRQIALADFDGTAQMNVAGNAGASSSLLDMLPLHNTVAPQARYVGTEEVEVHRLDTIGATIVGGSHAGYLKIDVQGAEQRVITGATGMLQTLSAVQLELSLFDLYDDAPLFNDLIAAMGRHGFRLAGLEPGLPDPDGRLLQVDGLFIRDARTVALAGQMT